MLAAADIERISPNSILPLISKLISDAAIVIIPIIAIIADEISLNVGFLFINKKEKRMIKRGPVETSTIELATEVYFSDNVQNEKSPARKRAERIDIFNSRLLGFRNFLLK